MILKASQIERSLSRKGNPHDNAIAESTYESAKVEFIYPNKFTTLHELEVKLGNYVHWWSYLRLHGSLDYETPIAFRHTRLAKRILKNEIGYGTNKGVA